MIDRSLRLWSIGLLTALSAGGSSATATQHEQIANLIDRFNSVPPDGRRITRIFKVRNRGVSEILSVLQSLISSGAGDLPDSLGNRTESSTASPVPPAPGTTPLAAPTPGDATSTGNPSRADASSTVTRNESRRGSGGDNRGSTSTQFGADQPEVRLTADEGTSSIIAVGDPRVLSQIEKLIQQLDLRQPQVMVQAMVVSLSDSQTRQLGIELEGQLNLSGDSILRLASLFGLSSAGAQVGQRAASGAGGIRRKRKRSCKRRSRPTSIMALRTTISAPST